MVSWPSLLLKVAEVFEASGRRYGSPRITTELLKAGLRVGRRRVMAAMVTLGLTATRGNKQEHRGNRKNLTRTYRTRTTTRCVEPDRIRRKFRVARLDRRWVSDISDLGLAGRHRYLCVVLDLASRRVTAWRSGPAPDSRLVSSALRLAMRVRHPTPGLIIHSDRGGEYANHMVGRYIRKQGALQSMSRRGNCWDNAVAESFFATLKRECLYLLDADQVAARPAAVMRKVGQYIEWYNEQRLHSTLGYRSPAEYERLLLSAKSAK